MKALRWLKTLRGRVAIAGALAAAWLIYMGFYAVPQPVDGPPPVSPGSTPVAGHETLWGLWIIGAFLFAWFAFALWAAIRLARNDATRFHSLPPDEKARRHEAGELLKHEGAATGVDHPR